MIRQLVVALVGHVDHGKSSILEKIRGISILKSEPGLITQTIKSYDVSIKDIEKICGTLLKKLNLKISLPGLLLIDTPGHASFTNLRKRGGSLADLAILVIDINEGFKPQTTEALEILKAHKTPFIVALNKLDLISGWKTQKINLFESISLQSEAVQKKLNEKLYEIVGKLYHFNINSERFDRIEDYTKQISIVPCSAKTGEGIPELLMIITGIAQKYLDKCLACDVTSPGKGTILEIKEERGTGIILDTIVYDGCIKINDTLIIGNINEPITAKVRGLFKTEKNKLIPVKETYAASGIKIFSPDIKEATAGMPLRVANKDIEKIKKQVQKEVEDIIIETDQEGIIIKTNSLGALEALIHLFKEKSIKIKKASIGNISKKDMAEAESEKDPLNRVIIGFNVKQEARSKNIKVILGDVIYKTLEDFEAWKESESKSMESRELEKVVKPCKLEILPYCIFRQSNPAIIGIEMIAGNLKTNTPLMKEGQELTRVKSMQSENKNISELAQGKQAAISLPGITVGKQINERDILYSDIPEADFRKLKKFKKYLKPQEIGVLKEIAQIKRKKNPAWGI